jgi:hypothetical protein
MEQFDFLKEFEETINKLPAEMKYPALVMLGNAVADVTKSREEYIQSIEKMKQQFMKMFMSSIFDDDSSVN